MNAAIFFLTAFRNLKLARVPLADTSATLGEWSVKDGDGERVGRIWKLTEDMYEWESGDPMDGCQGISHGLHEAYSCVARSHSFTSGADMEA